MRKFLSLAVFFGCLLSLISCAGKDDYRQAAIAFAAPHFFQARTINAPPFQLFALVKKTQNNAPWRVYLEGDGRAYINYELSPDPTPANNLVLELAASDSNPNILYLARPCQFVESNACDPQFWSTGRYSEIVINSMLSAIQQTIGEAKLELIGYSGGGTLAALLAPSMPNVAGIRTLAANLSVREQADYLRLSPLSASLDPIDFVDQLRKIPQIHLIAAKDTAIIPPQTIQHFERALHSACAQFIPVPDVSHAGPWQKVWQQWQSAPFNPCP